MRGRGFGFVSIEVTKYVCRNRAVTIPRCSTASSDSIGRGSVNNANIKSRNLTTPGRLKTILTGIEGATLIGDKSENFSGLEESED